MTKIQKENIYIDSIRQTQEKNISINDYPVFNIETGRRLKHRFGYYFKDMDDYYTSKNPEFKNWTKGYRQNAFEAYKFYDDIEHREVRYK
jgi:hypothetical protein